MIQFPQLQKGQTIGVTAPSSGVQPSLHDMFQLSCERMKKEAMMSYVEIRYGTRKGKSAPAVERAKELQYMMTCD